MKTTGQILKDVYGIAANSDEDLQLYITLNPAQDKIEWAMKEYALQILQEFTDNHIGWYEDDHVVYSGNSEHSAIVDKERLEKFKQTIKQ